MQEKIAHKTKESQAITKTNHNKQVQQKLPPRMNK